MIRALKVDGRVVVTDVLYWNGSTIFDDMVERPYAPEDYPQWLKDGIADGTIVFDGKVIRLLAEEREPVVIECDMFFAKITLPYEKSYWEWYGENRLYFDALSYERDGDLLFHFEAPRRGRNHRYGWAATVLWASAEEPLWWDSSKRRWVDEDSRQADFAAVRAHVEAVGDDHAVTFSHSSHSEPIRTLKAFKRHVRKHREDLSGQLLVWVTRFQDHSVYVRIP